VNRFLSEEELNLTKQAEINLKRQLLKLPENQQDEVERTSRIIEQTMIDVENSTWTGESFRLHEKMKSFFVTHNLDDDDYQREVLQNIVYNTKNNSYFTFQAKRFKKSCNGLIIEIDDYVYTLEKAILAKESLPNLCTYITMSDIFTMLIIKTKLFLGGICGKK
jgi:hypothetical protein